MNQSIELSTSEGDKIRAEGVNISESGMLCRTAADIPKGTFVLFEITIPGSSSPMKVKCEGIIMKCEKEGSAYNVVIDFTDSPG